MKRWRKAFLAAAVLAMSCSAQEAAEDNTVTEELQEIFDQASEGLIGIRLIPEALLDTQTATGTYYRILCEKQNIGMVLDTGKQYAVVTVYMDPDGSAQIVDMEDADK